MEPWQIIVIAICIAVIAYYVGRVIQWLRDAKDAMSGRGRRDK